MVQTLTDAHWAMRLRRAVVEFLIALQREEGMELERRGQKNEQSIATEQGKKKRGESEIDQRMVMDVELAQVPKKIALKIDCTKRKVKPKKPIKHTEHLKLPRASSARFVRSWTF